MTLSLRFLRWGLIALLGAVTLGLMLILGAYLYVAPSLPAVEALREVRLQVPLRVFTRDGLLLAEYGEKRRVPLTIDQIPLPVRQAFLAAEDDRFYEHPGVDWQGVLRAAINLAVTGEKSQGASTITMQVARNFFLSSEKTYNRKLKEVFLALKIERELSKDEILELYLNKIYLGNRAYGIGAAASVYYGTDIAQLELPQVAMIAGLPKAPSTYNPIVNPERARIRRDYVLGRMRSLGFIDEEAYQAALAAPVTARLHRPPVQVDGPYVGEMVRAELVSRFGEEEAYTGGYRVYTTVDSRLQRVAQQVLRAGLVAYDLRHGYRGPEARVELPEGRDPETLDPLLSPYSEVGGLRPALVLAASDSAATLYLGGGQTAELTLEGVLWAKRYVDENTVGPEPTRVRDVVRAGDVVRVVSEELPPDPGAAVPAAEERPAPHLFWQLRQVPEVAGALVSLDPNDGSVLALSGGFDFYQSKFNRAVQAERQPGSAFKPFIYSAALEKGFTPASIINDAPVVFEDAALESTWRPENYSGKFYGPTRLRVALTNSRNLVSIRVLRSIGVGYALEHVARFGFPMDHLPRDLSLALGSGTVTPLELARGYAAFANGGFLVTPYFIERIEDAAGQVLYREPPSRPCEDLCPIDTVDPAASGSAGSGEPTTLEVQADQVPPSAGEPAEQPVDPVLPAWRPAPRVVPAQNAYQMVSMMQDVIRQGTARRALVLQRSDLSGKTGTTNDQNDAWFCGFNGDVVTTVWVGFDQLKPLGAGETGAGAALPIWVDFMAAALAGRPEHSMSQPEGMVTVRIDPETGLLAGADTPDAIFETFRADEAPTRAAFNGGSVGGGSEGVPAAGGAKPAEIPEQLF